MRPSSAVLVLSLSALATALPVDASLASHVYVPVLLKHGSSLRYRPTKMIVAGDGSELLSRIRYRSYGGREAEAVATVLIDDCVPSCSAGTFHPVKASLVLGTLVKCQQTHVYTELTMNAPQAPRFNHLRRRKIYLDYLAGLCEPPQR